MKGLSENGARGVPELVQVCDVRVFGEVDGDLRDQKKAFWD